MAHLGEVVMSTEHSYQSVGGDPHARIWSIEVNIFWKICIRQKVNVSWFPKGCVTPAEYCIVTFISLAPYQGTAYVSL